MREMLMLCFFILVVITNSGFSSAFVPSHCTLWNKQKLYGRVLSRIPGTSLTAIKKEFALLFDCDGVILETEEFHRLAYNDAFNAAELTIDGKPVEWSVEYYGKIENDLLFLFLPLFC